jgi:hypothetical protein
MLTNPDLFIPAEVGMPVPERVKFIPDRETVETNRHGELTPEQRSFYQGVYPTLTIDVCEDEYIYDEKYAVYILRDTDVFYVGGFAEEHVYECLLPGIRYRFYRLKEGTRGEINFLSAEALEEPDWDVIQQGIIRDLQKMIGFTDGDLAANRVGKLSIQQAEKMPGTQDVLSREFSYLDSSQLSKLPFSSPEKGKSGLLLGIKYKAYYLPKTKKLLSIEPIGLPEIVPALQPEEPPTSKTNSKVPSTLPGDIVIIVMSFLTSLMFFGLLILVGTQGDLCLDLFFIALGLFFLFLAYAYLHVAIRKYKKRIKGSAN